jgi:hypothetical protein
MAKKKTVKTKQKRKGKNLNIWIEGVLREAIGQLADRNRRPLTEEVSIALENHLSAAGLWPPPAKH